MEISTGSDFCGIGAFDQALDALGISQRKIFACDWDKFARQTYIENYGEPAYFPKDVYEREIPAEPLDVYMTSPPCQAFSLAGKRDGEDDKRGVLFYNSHEFIQVNKPRFFIFENVKGLCSHDGGRTFGKWIDLLAGKSVNGNPVIFPHQNSVPYHVYFRVLNAKHFGIPQNRERIFIVGIRDDHENHFTWPKPFPLKKCLGDVLQENVDEKYFLSEKMLNGFVNHGIRRAEKGNGFVFSPSDINKPERSVTTNAGSRNTDNFIVCGYINQKSQSSLVYDESGISQALAAGTHGYVNGYIKVRSATKCGYELAGVHDSINLSVPSSQTRRGRVGKGVAQTLDTACNQGVVVAGKLYGGNQEIKVVKYGRSEETKKKRREIYQSTGKDSLSFKDKELIVVDQQYYDTILANPNPKKEGLIYKNHQIRRLTPRECLRLMDFPDSFKIVVSDTQAYKQAGNSIPVGLLKQVIKSIFRL